MVSTACFSAFLLFFYNALPPGKVRTTRLDEGPKVVINNILKAIPTTVSKVAIPANDVTDSRVIPRVIAAFYGALISLLYFLYEFNQSGLKVCSLLQIASLNCIAPDLCPESQSAHEFKLRKKPKAGTLITQKHNI